MQRRKTFDTICADLDATLLYARVRIAYKKGLSRNTIAKIFGIKPKKVAKIVAGTYCTEKQPSLPRRTLKMILGMKTWHLSCSETRIKRNSRYHSLSHISGAEHRHGWSK